MCSLGLRSTQRLSPALICRISQRIGRIAPFLWKFRQSVTTGSKASVPSYSQFPAQWFRTSPIFCSIRVIRILPSSGFISRWRFSSTLALPRSIGAPELNLAPGAIDNAFQTSAVLWIGNHHCVGIDLGYAEVAAEVDQVEWAQVAGDLDHIHVAGAAGEYSDSVDIGSGEMQPEVGGGAVDLRDAGRRFMGIDQVFPAGCAISGDDRGHGVLRVGDGMRIAIVVVGNAGESCGCAIRTQTLGLQYAAGGLQH